MEQENSTFNNVNINDIVLVSKKQKKGEDGELLGYNFYQWNKIGILVAKVEDSLSIKVADASIEEINLNDEKYYYTIELSSEILFEQNIKDVIEIETKSLEDQIKKVEKIEDWYEEFKTSLSFFYKLKMFLKSYSK